MQPLQGSNLQSHQAMGYDRSSTMFSPEGRLLQVEYAKKAVKLGTTSLGIVCKDGVVLLADKRVLEPLLIARSIEKVFQIDDHLAASATGFLMDARVLIEKAQLLAQQHRVSMDTEMDVLSLVKEVANMKQAYTQYGGARPFGVSIIFAGVDEVGSQLFVTDVTGMFFQYKATAIGEFETQIKEFFEQNYKDGISVDAGIKLGIDALKFVLAKDFDVNRIDGAIVSGDGHFKRLEAGSLASGNKKK